VAADGEDAHMTLIGPHHRRPGGTTNRIDAKLQRMANVPLLAGCGESDLVELGRRFELCDVRPGTVLATEGEHAAYWTLVVEGIAISSRDGMPVRLLGPEAFFGEDPVARHRPSTITVTALTAMTLLVIDARTLKSLAAGDGAMAARLRASSARAACHEPRPVGFAAKEKIPASPTVGGAGAGC
jgi:CRP-like cAMP-binding protein